jgi:hypothetical protein
MPYYRGLWHVAHSTCTSIACVNPCGTSARQPALESTSRASWITHGRRRGLVDVGVDHRDAFVGSGIGKIRHQKSPTTWRKSYGGILDQQLPTVSTLRWDIRSRGATPYQPRGHTDILHHNFPLLPIHLIFKMPPRININDYQEIILMHEGAAF